MGLPMIVNAHEKRSQKRIRAVPKVGRKAPLVIFIFKKILNGGCALKIVRLK
jgi:hypothetical protein